MKYSPVYLSLRFTSLQLNNIRFHHLVYFFFNSIYFISSAFYYHHLPLQLRIFLFWTLLSSSSYFFHHVYTLTGSSQWECSGTTARCYNRSPSKLDYDDALAYCSGLNPVSPLPETANTSLLFVSTGAEIGEVETIFGITDQYVWVNCNDRLVEGDFICVIDDNGTTTAARSKNWRQRYRYVLLLFCF